MQVWVLADGTGVLCVTVEASLYTFLDFIAKATFAIVLPTLARTTVISPVVTETPAPASGS